VFVIDYYREFLPGIFALPAGWGDFAIGITAPLVAWLWKPPYRKKTFIVWNLLGQYSDQQAIRAAVPLGRYGAIR
jgi:hypothetical protein